MALQDLRVIQVLQALHHFFESLGSNEIRRRGVEEDKPLRMAKTLLHELCKHKVRFAIAMHSILLKGVWLLTCLFYRVSSI